MPLDSTGYLSPTSYGEKDILFHRPTVTEQEQANSSQSVRARRAVDEDGEVLRRAADIMEERGHCPNAALGPDGSVCIIMAITCARGDFDGALNRLGLPDVVGWNETHTKAEVIARLRSAAEQRA